MKRLAIVILALCIAATSFAENISGPHFKKKAAAGGTSYSYIIFHDSFEGATNADKPASIARSLQSAAARDNGSTPTAAVGSYSLDCPTSYDRVEYTVTNNDILVGSEGRIGFFIWWDAAPGNLQNILLYAPDASHEINLKTNTSAPNPHLTLYYKAGGESTGNIADANQFSTGQWYFIEFAWDNPGNSYKLYINGVEGASSTSNLPDWTATGGTLQVGATQGISDDFHIDQIIISNDSTTNLYAIRNNTSFPD